MGRKGHEREIRQNFGLSENESVTHQSLQSVQTGVLDYINSETSGIHRALSSE